MVDLHVQKFRLCLLCIPATIIVFIVCDIYNGTGRYKRMHPNVGLNVKFCNLWKRSKSDVQIEIGRALWTVLGLPNKLY